MAKYSLSGITKLLEKLFNAGFTDEKSILAIQLEDLDKMNISPNEIKIILDLKKAIRTKKMIAFLYCNKESEEK
ncbi:MAG: hypothetical protein IJ842_03435 [Bacilli bacterium]|nr:hypothetical protein [Bacilli bacterium]